MRPLVLAGTVAAAALLALEGCVGETTDGDGGGHPCSAVACTWANEHVRCDPTDMICKCGPFELNLVCKPDEVCVPHGDRGYTCESTACKFRECDRGQRCEPTTGACVCGEDVDAPACEEWQTCEQGRCTPGSRCEGVDCGDRGACDPADGACRCGGVVCDAFETCAGEAGTERCEVDPCHGVNCPDGFACNRDDALCHCGGVLGPVCAAGQACFGGECVVYEPCQSITCGPGAVCDPGGGPGQEVCRCGGIGPEHPECDASRGGVHCIQHDDGAWECVRGGGDPCVDRRCDEEVPGSTCDPEDGKCKCGGLDGVPCEDLGLACAVEDSANVCTTVCDPLDPGACSGERACTYEPDGQLALCLLPGDTQGTTCRRSVECPAGFFCPAPGELCRKLCDLAPDDGEPGRCPEGLVCSPIPDSPYPWLGQCLVSG